MLAWLDHKVITVWLRSFIWSSDVQETPRKEDQIALIKNNLKETDGKITKITKSLQKINEKNQETAKKNKDTFEGLKNINKKLLLLEYTCEFDKFCDYLIKDYQEVGYDCHNIEDVYSITGLKNSELKLHQPIFKMKQKISYKF